MHQRVRISVILLLYLYNIIVQQHFGDCDRPSFHDGLKFVPLIVDRLSGKIKTFLSEEKDYQIRRKMIWLRRGPDTRLLPVITNLGPDPAPWSLLMNIFGCIMFTDTFCYFISKNIIMLHCSVAVRTILVCGMKKKKKKKLSIHLGTAEISGVFTT